MTMANFINHQFVDFSKNYPCIIFVANCLECKFEMFALKQNKKYQCLNTVVKCMGQVCYYQNLFQTILQKQYFP